VKRVIGLLASAAMPLWVCAQTAIHPCQLIENAKDRGACLLKAFPPVSAAIAAPATTAAAPAPEKSTPVHGPTLYVHSSADVTDFGALDLGDNGAQFSGTRAGGKTATSVDVGGVLVFPAWSSNAWQPFVYGSWSRDTSSADDKSDKRTLGAGVQGWYNTGSHVGPQRGNLYIYTSATLARRADVYGADDAVQLGLKFDFVKLNWAQPGPGVIGFIPHVGLLAERRDAGGGATTDGNWSSLYAGSRFSYQVPVAGLQGVTLSALARASTDLSAPGGNDRRHLRFGKLKASYDLFKDKDATVKPSLFVSRQAGTDILSGTNKAKTQFGLQLTIN
jgi:hypothetical protein